MDYKNFLRRQVTVLMITIIGIVVIVTGATYAIFLQKDTNTYNQVVTTGELEVTYEGGNNITGEFLPKSTSEAMLEAGYSFTVENTGSLPATYKIMLYNNFEGDTSNYLPHNQLYISFDNGTPQLISTLEKEDNEVIVENNIVYLILEDATVGVGETESHNVKVWLKEDAEAEVVGKKVNLILEVESVVDPGTYLREEILANNEIKTPITNMFDNISDSTTTGLYSYPEGTGTSYFFRGDKTTLNNNVIFGGHQWKVIRIDYEGNIKLIYNGVCAGDSCAINDLENSTCEAAGTAGTNCITSIGTSAFNTSSNQAQYIGYTYGADNNTASTIKTAIENWYSSNLTSYDEYIADVVYCNDRESTVNTYTTYGATNRVAINYQYSANYNKNAAPSLDCTNIADSYTKEEVVSRGNGQLNQKIGLITADEVIMAGGKNGTNNLTYYLYNKQYYWTLSPFYWNGVYAYGWNVHSTGSSDGGHGVYIVYGVRQVIALDSGVQITGGDGSTTSPYIVLTN